MGYHLAIDQASKEAGFSLWKDGQYVTGGVLVCKHGEIGFRLQNLVKQLNLVLHRYLSPTDKVDIIIGENVRNNVVMACLGAFLMAHEAIVGRLELVSPSSWKARARVVMPGVRDPKGIPALIALGWDTDKFEVQDDNHADSIMIYLAYKAKKGLDYDTEELPTKVRRNKPTTKKNSSRVPKMAPPSTPKNKGRKIRRRLG